VKFTPVLNAGNQAPAGWFTMPVTVQRQSGAPAATARSLKVDVSYDDGATWKPALVTRAGDHWLVRVNQPASGYVSLHAVAVDSAGNTVDQTVIHAYALTRPWAGA
jgi:hypothetical protein